MSDNVMPPGARPLWQCRCQVLHEGNASGRSVKLSEALSFWGGFDPKSGRIIDRHHNEYGRSLDSRILILPSTRGSAGTPAGLAESLRTGHGPSAIVLGRSDVNLMIGAAVATRLYTHNIPVLVADNDDYDRLSDDQWVMINNDDLTVFALPDLTL